MHTAEVLASLSSFTSWLVWCATENLILDLSPGKLCEFMCSEQPRQAVIVNSIFHFVLRKDGSENESKHWKIKSRVFMRLVLFLHRFAGFRVSEFQLFVNAILLPSMCICNLQQETSHLKILQSSSVNLFLMHPRKSCRDVRKVISLPGDLWKCLESRGAFVAGGMC